MNNFTYSRRIKAEVSNGIGEFLNCMEILVKLSIISNVGTLFFTSNTMYLLFTVGWEGIQGLFPRWTKLEFLIFLIVVEHIMMIGQMSIALIVDDTPDYVIKGELERKELFKLYKKREHQRLAHGGDRPFEFKDGVDAKEAQKSLDNILAGC